MGTKFARFINAAQRKVVISNVRSSSHADLERVEVEIRGIKLETATRTLVFDFADMAEHGVRQGFTVPLGLLDRLRRVPAAVGQVGVQDSGDLELTFWSDPQVRLYLAFESEQDRRQWEEAHILMLSGGFDLQLDPSGR